MGECVMSVWKVLPGRVVVIRKGWVCVESIVPPSNNTPVERQDNTVEPCKLL